MAGPKKSNNHDTVNIPLPHIYFNFIEENKTMDKTNSLDHQIMARAVMLPITNFNPGTPRLDGVEPRLKQMIANSDALDSQVR
jgi:hypothetical protein